MVITTKARADLVFRTLSRMYGEATYDEVLVIFKDMEGLLECMTFEDVAWGKLFTDRNHFIDYLTALNVLHDLGRTEHTVTLKVMIAGGRGEVCEVGVTVPIPKSLDKECKYYLDQVKDYVKPLYVETGLTSLPVSDYIQEIVIVK